MPIEHEIDHEAIHGIMLLSNEKRSSIAEAASMGVPEQFLNNNHALCNKINCKGLFKKMYLNHEEEPEKMGFVEIDFNGNEVSGRIIDKNGKEIHA